MKDNFRIYDENYEEHAERTSIEDLSSVYIDMLDEFTDNYAKNLIVDIGCAVGRDLEYILKKSNCTGVGIDASKNMVYEAEKFRIRFHRLYYR
jgi:SAM-dependent methyltransferase